MNLDKLFSLVDSIIGEVSTFKGLTFNVESGILTIDLFDNGVESEPIFICDFVEHNGIEPVSFAAVDVEELKEQIAHYVL